MTEEEFWQEYLDSLPDSETPPDSYAAWSFGDTPEMADAFGKLVAIAKGQ